MFISETSDRSLGSGSQFDNRIRDSILGFLKSNHIVNFGDIAKQIRNDFNSPEHKSYFMKDLILLKNMCLHWQ